MPRKRRIGKAVRNAASAIGGKIAGTKTAQRVSHGARVIAGRQLTRKSMRKMDSTSHGGYVNPNLETHKVGFAGRMEGIKSQGNMRDETYYLDRGHTKGRNNPRRGSRRSVNKTFDSDGRIVRKHRHRNSVVNYNEKKKK